MKTISKTNKPLCKLIGENSNIFNLVAIANSTLRSVGMSSAAIEMINRIVECGSYDEALYIIGEYVTIC